jgi:WD40 repeat protein
MSEDSVAATGHSRGLSAVAVSADGKWIATAGFDRAVKTWDAAAGLERNTLAARSDETLSLAFSPDGKLLLAGGVDGKIGVWDLVGGQELKAIDEKARVPALVVLPGGKKLVAWLRKKSDSEVVSSLQTYETDTGNLVDTYTDRGREVTCLAFSPDGELAASGDVNGTVRVVNVGKRERVRGDLPAHAKSLADIALTPDKKTLITADEDGELKVWDLTNRESLHTIQAHKSSLQGVAVSADGARFATTDKDGQIRIWDTKTGKQLREWELHMAVRGFVFTPDGKHLVTANANGTAYLLDLP